MVDYQFLPNPSIAAPTILYVPPLIYPSGYSIEVELFNWNISANFIFCAWNYRYLCRRRRTSTGCWTRPSPAWCSSPRPTQTWLILCWDQKKCSLRQFNSYSFFLCLVCKNPVCHTSFARAQYMIYISDDSVYQRHILITVCNFGYSAVHRLWYNLMLCSSWALAFD